MGNLVCTIGMDKSKGVSIEIKDTGSNVTQWLLMDGKSITLEIKGAAGSSKLVQTADGLEIKCSKLTFDADSITCKARGAVKVEGTSVKLKGTQGVELSGMTVKVDASGIATLKGNMTNVQGQLIKVG